MMLLISLLLLNKLPLSGIIIWSPTLKRIASAKISCDRFRINSIRNYIIKKKHTQQFFLAVSCSNNKQEVIISIFNYMHPSYNYETHFRFKHFSNKQLPVKFCKENYNKPYILYSTNNNNRCYLKSFKLIIGLF